MTTALLQSAAAPGQLEVLLYFLGIVVSILLSTIVLVKGFQSYRQTRDPALLGMAAGILLLSGVPLLLSILLLNTADVTGETTELLSELTRLGGLGLILFVIYRTQR